jgi:hypothetical protein
MTQPDQQAFNTDSGASNPVAKRNSFLDVFNRLPRPLLYGALALGLFGGILSWYLFNANPTAEPVVDTPALTQPTATPVTPDTTPTAATPGTTPNVVDPNSNLSRALEVQDIPFLVTTEGSGNAGKSPTSTEIATPNGNGSASSAGLNPFAPIPTPPAQAVPSQAIQQPSPDVIASIPTQPTNSVQIPSNLNRTPTVNPQINNSAPTVIIKRPTPLPTPTTTVQKPTSLSNGTKANTTKPATTNQTNQKPTATQTTKPTATQNTKPVQKPTTPTVPTTPTTPTTSPEPVVITSRPDIRVPGSTSTGSLPIAGGGGVLPVAPQIIQKVNPPQVAQIPVVVPQVQPTKPLELPNEGSVITPDTSSSSGGLKPSGTNGNAGSVDPLNTTITPTKPQTPVVVPVTPPVVVTPVEPPKSILNEFISERQLRYLDYVGGPFPQARLEIKGKSVIVGLGETIPDSKVVVKSITASEMVLLLGEETLTIPRTDK